MSVAWARTARVCRGTVPLSSSLELWDVQRFKELPPRPGFVISPPRWEVQLTHTFALLTKSLWTSVRESKTQHPIRGRDRGLQLFPVNQEFLVGASHKLVSITSLPFVHTARRYWSDLSG